MRATLIYSSLLYSTLAVLAVTTNCRSVNPKNEAKTSGGNVSAYDQIPEYVSWQDIVSNDILAASEKHLLQMTLDTCSNSSTSCQNGITTLAPLKLKEDVTATRNAEISLPAVEGSSKYSLVLSSASMSKLSAGVGAKLAGKGLNIGGGLGISQVSGEAVSVLAGVIWGTDMVQIQSQSAARPWFQCYARANVANALSQKAQWQIEAGLGIDIGKIINLKSSVTSSRESTSLVESKWDLVVKSNKYTITGDAYATQNLGPLIIRDYCSLWLNGIKGSVDPATLIKPKTALFSNFYHLFRGIPEFKDEMLYSFNFSEGGLGKALVDATYVAYLSQYVLPELAKKTGQEIKECNYDDSYEAGNTARQGLSVDDLNCSASWMQTQLDKQTFDDPSISMVMAGRTSVVSSGLKPFCKQNRASNTFTGSDGKSYYSAQTKGHCVIVQTRPNYPCAIWAGSNNTTETKKPNFLFSPRKINYASFLGAEKLTPGNLPPLIYRYHSQDMNPQRQYFDSKTNGNIIGPDPEQTLDASTTRQLSSIMEGNLSMMVPYFAEGECAPNLQCRTYIKADFLDLTERSKMQDGFPEGAGICKPK